MKKGTSKTWTGSFFGGSPSPEDRGGGIEVSRSNNTRQASDVDPNVIEVANEAGEGDAAIANDNTGKIKFKRAKKFGAHYTKALQNTKSSRFQDWTKMEMVMLLVSEGVELRNESNIEKLSLRDLCEALYFERDMPEKPALPTIFDIIRLNSAARKVQNLWVVRQYEKRYNQERETDVYNQSMNMGDGEFGSDDLGLGAAELSYMTAPRQMVIGGRTTTAEDDEAMNQSSESLGIDEGTEADGTAGSEAGAGLVRRPSNKRVATAKKKGSNVLDAPWEKPDAEKAKRFSDFVQPRKGGKGGAKYNFWETTSGRHCCLGNVGEQLDLWEEGQISEFGIYGSGVTNYFKFIKWCFWLFMILAIVAIPAVILNDSGPSQANNGLQALARTTAGNLVSPYANVTVSLKIPGCNSYGVYNLDCSLNKSTLAEFYAYLDIAIVCIAFMGFLWLRVFEVVEERTLEKNTVNASMFTVTVSKLPKDCGEEDIIAHFGAICPTHKIANISLAFDNAREIEECTKRGDIIRLKVRSVHEHRHYCTKLKEKLGADAAAEKITKEREKFYLKMAALSEELKAKEELLAKFAETPARPIFAFVTFDRAAGREAILEAFNGNSFLYNYLYNQRLKLKGKWLHVEPSPEPSTILWENLAYGKWDCYRRRAFTSVVALLMIFISLAMIFSAKYLEQVNNNASAASLCPSDFGAYSQAEKKAYVRENPDQLSCYCDGLSTLEQSTDHLCQDYLRKNIQSQTLTYFASFIVLLVNVAIEKVLKLLSAFEKHNNEDERGLSTFLRLFILKYINTTLVFFINNNNVILEKIFGVVTPSTTEFTADWFNTIGVTVILVQLGDVYSCHGDKFFKWFAYERNKRLSRINETALTQDDLNNVQVGPEFEFAFSYAQLLSTMFCCFTFSTGIPILYVICMVNFFIYYFVEKYLFIHLYRIPPHFGNNVGKRATAILPYAFVLHLIMSIWMLSSNDIFSSDPYDPVGINTLQGIAAFVRHKITGRATFPLFVFLVAIVVIRLFTHLYKATSKTVTAVLEKMCGTRCLTNSTAAKKKAASAMAVVTYTRAVQRNLIKGLATYNILQNPIYKESFAITWKFAMANKSVRSVRNNKARAQSGNDETDADRVEHMQRNFKASRPQSKKMLSNRGFSSSFYQPKGPDGGENESEANTPADRGGATAEEGEEGDGVPLGAVTDRESRDYTALVSGSAHGTPHTSNGSSPRNARPASVNPQGRPMSVNPQQQQRALPPTPRNQQQQQQAAYANGVPAAMYDPAALEEQRRLYAQFQAQQQGGSPRNGSPRGGRSVNVTPLGSRVPSGNFSYTTASATYQYGSQSGAQTTAYAQGYATSGTAATSTILAQQQAYEAAQRSSRGRSSQSAPSSRTSQSAAGSSRGGSQHGYTPIGRGPVIGPDGFEVADHLLYD